MYFLDFFEKRVFILFFFNWKIIQFTSSISKIKFSIKNRMIFLFVHRAFFVSSKDRMFFFSFLYIWWNFLFFYLGSFFTTILLFILYLCSSHCTKYCHSKTKKKKWEHDLDCTKFFCVEHLCKILNIKKNNIDMCLTWYDIGTQNTIKMEDVKIYLLCTHTQIF